MIKFNFKNQKGYAILFTVVIVSAISVITAGLSNVAYKQLILSSLAKDSQAAFYQADTASDCALYADRVNPLDIIAGGSWSCGTVSLVVATTANGYTINPTAPADTALTPCFRITVTKDSLTEPLYIITTISARGYNMCNLNNLRTVEREIQIKYQELKV